jgi:hypothetical protein
MLWQNSLPEVSSLAYIWFILNWTKCASTGKIPPHFLVLGEKNVAEKDYPSGG